MTNRNHVKHPTPYFICPYIVNFALFGLLFGILYVVTDDMLNGAGTPVGKCLLPPILTSKLCNNPLLLHSDSVFIPFHIAGV